MSALAIPPSAEAEMEQRTTFGIRAGSIRGILALMVLGMVWGVAFLSKAWKTTEEVPLIYILLQNLLVLIVAYYFPPYGSTPPRSKGDRRRLHLWPEAVPWIVLLGMIGLGVHLYYTYHARQEKEFVSRLLFTLAPLVVLGGFFAGYLVSAVISFLSGGRLPAWLQDLQAWAALVAMVGLLVELCIHFFILGSLDTLEARQEWQTFLVPWEGVLAGLIAFYYGARSETPRLSS